MTVIGELSSAASLISLYVSSNPDLVIMNVGSSSEETNDIIKTIINHDQQAKIIVSSHLGFQDEVQGYLNSGAKDFILKPYKIEEIERIFNLVGI
jgi:two-component system chemotaxis response regulator CheY